MSTVNPELEPQRADSRQNKAEIVEAAIRVLGDQPHATIAAVAAAAGVDRSTVYRRFPNRDALIEHLKVEVVADFIDVLDRATERSDRDALRALEDVIRHATRLSDRYRFLNLYELPMDDTDAGSRWLGLLDEAQRAGHLRPDLPLAWMSAVVRNLVEAGTSMVRRGVMSRDEAARYTVTTAIRALAPER